MAGPDLQVHTLANGVRAVVETIPGALSVSVSLRFDFGSKDDPPKKEGLAALAEATALKGCRGMSARRIMDALDDRGVDRESVTTAEHTNFAFNCLPEHLKPSLKLYGRALLSPTFPRRQIEVSRKLTEEAISDLEDSPARNAMRLAFTAALGRRLGRSSLGRLKTIRSVTQDDVRGFFETHRSPAALQVCIAGAIDTCEALKQVEEAFGHWPAGPARKNSRPRFRPHSAEKHCPGDHEQSHICLAYPTAPVGHRLHYAGVLAQTVLCGGSSARLLAEVREKRGLAYQVGGHYRSWRGGALMVIYAACTSARARKTLEVCLDQVEGLARMNRSHLRLAKAIVKGQLLTGGALAESRSATLANDLFLTGKPRRLSEIIQGVESVTMKEVRGYLRAFPPHPLTVVTLG